MRDSLVKKYLMRDIRIAHPVGDLDQDATGRIHPAEFSECNRRQLKAEFLKIRDRAEVIVEIGVCRLSSKAYAETSTNIFLSEKKRETMFVGIDVEDRSFLDNPNQNVHTILAASQDYSTVTTKLNLLGVTAIDFLFIDGWHSVNQVLDELYYFEYLRKGSIVGYHDTNYHPGPSTIVTAFDPTRYRVAKHCIADNDWGIAFVEVL